MLKILAFIIAATLLWISPLVTHSIMEEPSYGLRINCTQSMPYRLFLRVRASQDDLQRGVIVAFQHPHSEVPLAKYIGGLPHDTVSVFSNRVFVNNQCLGLILRYTPSGKELTPCHQGTIPEGYAFVHGEHPDSYDSRYKEFGLVKLDDIKDVLWPIF